MKRQKSPVVLVTVLVVIVGLALGARFFNPNALQGAPKAPDTVAGGSRPTESEDDIRNKVRSKTANLDNPGAVSAGGEVGALAEASILEPEMETYKPQPNDSTISAHWYDENHRKAKGD